MEMRTKLAMSPAEYIEWELGQELKHEYIDGEIIEMSGGSGEHSMIIGNIHGLLWNLLNFPQYTVHTSNMRVKFSPSRYIYPDLSVVRGESVYADASRLNLVNPVLVVEVTSPSSMMKDRVEKLGYYHSVPSVEAYLVVDQDRVHVEMHNRAAQGWETEAFSDITAVVPLPMLDCELPLATIYRGIALDEA